MTKAEIQARLDELGVDYPKSARVAELKALLDSAESLESGPVPDGSRQAPANGADECRQGLVTARVVRRFRDKHDGSIHEVGDTVCVTVERLSEMNEGRERVRL